MRNITPMKTPITEKKLFIFWAQIIFRARRIAS
jgi:hypothetical protein